MRYVRDNQGSAFGIAHGLADIRSPEDYQRQVPLADYDDHLPWINRIKDGEQNILTTAPVTRLVPTSGSSQARKLIPYTANLQREFNCAIGPWIVDLFRQQPKLMLGSAYWSISPNFQPNEEFNSRVPIGFDEDSAYLGGVRKRLVDSVMAVPGWVRHIESIEAFRYITMLLLLRRPDLSIISVWHPSFLEQMMDVFQPHSNDLITDIAKGGCKMIDAIPPAHRGSAIRALPAQPSRAKKLFNINTDDLTKIWPSLGLISCWADGHASAAAGALASRFQGVRIQSKGLLATEGVVTIPFGGMHPVALRSHFYEFLDAGGRCRMIDDLQVGKTYSVVITTAGGLWRYRLADQVEVTGYLKKTPCLKFIGKESHISDRFGEKLSDSFVGTCLRAIFATLGVSPTFAMLAVDVDGAGCRYTLYAQELLPVTLISLLDQKLCENLHYAYCRSLGQLLKPRLFVVSGGGFDAYSREMMRRGMRLGDIKPIALSPEDGWSQTFDGSYVIDESVFEHR